MESRKFDDITRALASGATRRGVLKGAFGGAIAGLLGRSHALAQDDCPGGKVTICHRTNSAKNPFNVIEVCSDSLPDHVAHGDLVTCPGAGFVDFDTCTCVCDLTCEGNFRLDEEACACFCPVDEIVCDPGFVLDEASCSCVCNLTDDDCPNLEVIDPDTCACFCPVDQITCPDGQTLNPDTCSCEAGPDPECAGAVCEVLQNCNERTDCFCFNTSEGGGFCAVSVSCSQLTRCFNGQSDCAEGELCLVDSCCVEPVCKPVTFGCAQPEGLRVQSQPAIVDDGPTTGGQ